MSFVYANSGSGPSAGGIGWFNFGSLSLTPGNSVSGLTGTLNDGSTVTFDIALSNVSGANRTFDASAVPTWGGTFFGTTNYTGIVGNVAMQSQLAFFQSSNTLTISNIVVKDSLGNLIPNYTAIVADAESTGMNEIWKFGTNGDNWKLFATLGNSTNPTLTGVGTPTVTFIGSDNNNQNDYVFTTQNPTTLTLNSETTSAAGGRQALVVGFSTTRLRLVKNIGERINANDQFVMNIAGTPNNQATTTGAINGIQPQLATVYAVPGNSYTLTEAMAAGSVSLLTDYTKIVSATNLTPGGTVPPLGNLPISVTTALGDDIVYIVLNAAPQTFDKKVDKAFADVGEVLTYTVNVTNPNDFAISNVTVTDSIPIGTTYIGNITSNTPYIGTNPASGITFPTIGANATATISWQVQVNATGPVVTPVVNVASVAVPNGTSGNTNVVSTAVKHADLTAPGNFTKSVDKAYANAGDELTYTLNVNNTGNTAANNIVITDTLPAGTSYVAGSISATVPFTGTPTTAITLTAPIAPSAMATITYKVKVNGIPSPNPVLNNADISYAYTVDPAKPNAVLANGTSNTVATVIATAKLNIIKTVDKTISYVGQELTYSLAITNTGNTPANNVVLTDNIPFGTAYVPGSLAANVPYVGATPSNIVLTNPINPAETVVVTFKVKVTQMPPVNPLANNASATFDYTLDPARPNQEHGSSTSNIVKTLIFRNNYTQQINDLIQSIALEEAAIAAIADAEGAKIQKMVAMSSVTNQELLCLNRSVADMSESLTALTNILRQKLSIVDCQINGTDC